MMLISSQLCEIMRTLTPGLAKHTKQMARDTCAAAQVTADGSDERQALDNLDLERFDLLLNVAHERVQRIVNVLLLHHGAKAVNTGGHVLDGDVIALEDRKRTAHKADAGLGAVAGDVDGDKTALGRSRR